MDFDGRLRKILSENDLDQTQAAAKVGLTGPSLSRFLNKKNEKSEEIDKIFNICENDDQKYFLATGKHLQQESEQKLNCTSDIQMLSNTIKDLSLIITQLSANVQELRAEIKGMREVNKSSRVRLRQKVPEDH